MSALDESLLSKLGFPFHAGDIYVYLLKSGGLAVDSLTKSSLESSDDFEEGLHWLIEQGYVYEQMDEKGVLRYAPSDPLIVSSSLFDRFLWLRMRFDTRGLPPTLSDREIQSLPDDEKEKILSYRRNCDEFVRCLSGYYSKRGNEGGLEYIRDEKQLAAVLSEAISSATESIFGVTTLPWTPNLPLVWGSLKAKIAQGVVYRRIADEITFISFGYAINKRDVETIGVQLRVMEAEKIDRKFYLIDDRLAINFWGTWPAKYGFEATRVERKWFVKQFKRKAEELWAAGVPAITCIDYATELRKQFIQRAQELAEDKGDLDLLRNIFDLGVFATTNSIASDDPRTHETLDRLCKEGLLMRIQFGDYPYGKMPYLPNIRAELLEFIRSGGTERDPAQFGEEPSS
jgi:hypothetical protein